MAGDSGARTSLTVEVNRSRRLHLVLSVRGMRLAIPVSLALLRGLVADAEAALREAA